MFVRVDSVTNDTIYRPSKPSIAVNVYAAATRTLELPVTASAPAKRVCGGEQRKRSDAVHALFLASAWNCSASWFHKRL